jgi:peroxisomal 3,2-trans-enoyl-CoA isomerase
MSNGVPFKATRAPPSTPKSDPITLTFPTLPEPAAAGSVAVITLNSPSTLNALRSIDMQQLIDTMHWINEQPSIIITVLTGTGRFFSAGANVKDAGRTVPSEITDLPPNDPRHVSLKEQFYAQRAYNNNSRLSQSFYHHNKLLVAALNGPAIGISAAVLGYCDLIYCFEEFWFSTPFTSLALVAEGGSTKTFVQKVGMGVVSVFCAVADYRLMH